MMGFETLTLAPIDRRLVVPELLSAEELAWLDAYHARVAERSARSSDPPTAPGWRRRPRRSQAEARRG